jgi:hypothetical protein
MFNVPTMALLTTIAQGRLGQVDVSAITSIPFATHGECGRDV